MIVVDGRTDREKLFELLKSGGECSELDFKETLDFSKKIDELDFVKDAVSMCNRYPGGYIVIGVDDDGNPSARSEDTNWVQFDGAVLTDKIRKYVQAPLTAISQLHEVDGHTYCLVCLLSLEDGLLVPFSKLGQTVDGKGRQIVVFREGEIVRRDGAQNRPIEYSQWAEILKQHDACVRKDESKRMDTLVDNIIAVLGEKGKTPPLVYGMDEEALVHSLEACFEQKENEKLSRFIFQVAAEFQDDADAINSLAGIGAYALSYCNDSIFEKAAGALYDCYAAIDDSKADSASKSLAVAVACYELGAQLVRMKRWDLIAPFVNRQSPSPSHFIYASWIRDCQVRAVNAGLFNEAGSGMMITVALDNATNHPIVAPNCGLNMASDASAHERYLDLLCSFDFLYCLCVFVAGVGTGLAYPACCFYSEKRISNVASQILGGDPKARRELLPDDDDDKIAMCLRELYRLASNESLQKDSKFYWGFDPSRVLRKFLQDYPEQSDEQPPDMFSYNNPDRGPNNTSH